jgi:aspartyl protease family protein
VRWLAPLALMIAALAALLLTSPSTPLLGLSHDDFARAGFGSAILVGLLLSGLARAGSAGAARVLTGAGLWALVGIGLVAVYAYRPELAEVGERIFDEFSPPTAHVGRSGEVVIRRRNGGEFIVPAKVNERQVNFILDTGASSVVLSAEDASAAGLPVAELDFTARVVTANGAATAAPVKIEKIAVGPIVVRGVQALVARPGSLNQSLLGMSFLDRLKSFSVEGANLVFKGK